MNEQLSKLLKASSNAADAVSRSASTTSDPKIHADAARLHELAARDHQNAALKSSLGHPGYDLTPKEQKQSKAASLRHWDLYTEHSRQGMTTKNRPTTESCSLKSFGAFIKESQNQSKS